MLKIKNKYKSPWTSRKKSQKKIDALLQRYNLLTETVGAFRSLPAELLVVKAPTDNLQYQEVCIFVTYAPSPQIKPYVAHHLNSLLSSGLKVILVINTDNVHQPLGDITQWMDRLSSIYIRENVGFDFAAWAHIFSLHSGNNNWAKLYLINDSIVGPINSDLFDNMMHRIRNSEAEIVGLVGNNECQYHLQSFFLVLSNKLLRHSVFQEYFKNIYTFSDKQLVVDVYEKRLTAFIKKLGFSTEEVYASGSHSPDKINYTIHYWNELIDGGFPYIKASVVREAKNEKRNDIEKIRELIPEFLSDI